MVKGVIFAGGYGKRLRPLTDRLPKLLIELKRNYTILDKQLLDFKYAGIDEIYLLVGYRYAKIKRRYGDIWNGLQLHYLVESKPMGTLWALKNCSRYVDDDIIVKNGDTVSDYNLREMINHAINSRYDVLIALTRMKSPYGIVDVEDDRIVGFLEKPLLDVYINAGVYYIKKGAFKYLELKFEEKELEKTFFQELVKSGLAGAYFEDVKWFPVDNFKDLEEVRAEYRGRRDTEYGYVKKKLTGTEYYVKKGYSATIAGKGKLSVLKGKGILNGNKQINQGENIDLSGRITYTANENSIILKV